MKRSVLLEILILIAMLACYSQAANIKITGFIKDSKTNERLIGALILNEGIGLAVSDSSGCFSFKLKPGKYLLECKYIGYEPKANNDYRVFNNFRRNSIYTSILGHVSQELG